MQYGKYVPSFSHFAIYDEIKAKHEKQEKQHEATCAIIALLLSVLNKLLKSNIAQNKQSRTKQNLKVHSAATNISPNTNL